MYYMYQCICMYVGLFNVAESVDEGRSTLFVMALQEAYVKQCNGLLQAEYDDDDDLIT